MERCAAMSECKIDNRVIEACQQGNREAFRMLFEAYKDRVYSISLHFFGGDEAAAGDATQQVFLKLITRIEQFHFDAEFTTWLYRLVTNECLDEQRRRRRFIPLGESSSINYPTMDRFQEKHYIQRENADSVRAAIAKLQPKLRVAVLLKYVEELSYDEIADVLGCSKGTVASRLNRGLKILARRLAHLRSGEAAPGE